MCQQDQQIDQGNVVYDVVGSYGYYLFEVVVDFQCILDYDWCQQVGQMIEEEVEYIDVEEDVVELQVVVMQYLQIVVFLGVLFVFKMCQVVEEKY